MWGGTALAEAKFSDFRLIDPLIPLYKTASYDMGDFKLKLQRGLLSGLLVCGAPVLAQNSLLSGEAAARSVESRDAYVLIEDGDVAYLKRDFKTAVSKYAQALAKLPEGAKAVAGLRATVVQRFSQASVVQAQSLMRKGDSKGAKALMDQVEAVDPDNKQVTAVRNKVDDPIRNNPALTPEHAANVDRVRRLLYEAEGYYDLGKFDHAMMTYEDVIRIDQYNNAARRGMERVNSAQSGYHDAAKDQARAELLKDVEAQWEQKSYRRDDVPVISDNGFSLSEAGVASLQTKLNTIIIPEVVLNGATLDEAIDFLRAASQEGDTSTLDESKKGIPFVIQLGDETHPAVQKIRSAVINLKLRNVPLGEVVRLVTEATGTSYRVDDFAVVLNATGFSDPSLIRRNFRVPPSFLNGGAAKAVGDGDPFGGDAAEGGLIAKTLTAMEKLRSYDVSFPEGATANYNPSTGTLTVRNTATNMRLIEAIVEEEAKTEPVIVAIKTTILDISQSNLEELGFDVILGELSVGGNAVLSGGTTGTGTAINDTIAGRPVTSGLRSGDLSNASDGLDALLTREAPTTSSGTFTTGVGGGAATTLSSPTGAAATPRASGIISLRGIIDGTAHELLMRGLSQKTGTDIKVRPEVMTLPGQNASIESIIEFPYPEDYDPPQLPNSTNGGSTAVTPATPSSFETRNLGVSLEVLPQVGADRRIIEVAVNPVITDFEGFVNYGTPIGGSSSTSVVNAVAGTVTTNGAFGEITPNAILKPLFRTIRGKTSLQILDGQTIVMGGLVSETRNQVNDKVPILGDLPLIGRIFRNDGVSVEKRSLLIFITVELLDPAGNPYRNR